MYFYGQMLEHVVPFVLLICFIIAFIEVLSPVQAPGL